jgi:virginiamycin B lyase
VLQRSFVALVVAALSLASAHPAHATLNNKIEIFPTDDSAPLVIAPGPADSNALWVTVDDEPTLLQITIGKEGAPPTIREVEMPKGFGDPRQIVLGPDAHLWVTGNGGVARITPAGVIVVSTHKHRDAFGIVAGPDGKMWFSYANLDASFGTVGRSIGRLSTDLSAFDGLDVSRHGLQLVFLTTGSDGNIWGITPCFFEGECSIARITPTGDVKVYKQSAGSRPYAMTAGPDGGLWYADYGKSSIGRVDPASGEVKDFTLEANTEPTFVIVGPDGALWFTESGLCKIGRMTLDGKVDSIAVPAKKCELFGITVGPDGNIWFTVTKPNAVGRVKLH